MAASSTPDTLLYESVCATGYCSTPLPLEIKTVLMQWARCKCGVLVTTFYATPHEAFPSNILMQFKGKINVKRGLNSAAKLWTQFNYNTTFEITIILLILIFTEIIYSLWYNTLIIKIEMNAAHNNDFELTITQQYLFSSRFP